MTQTEKHSPWEQAGPFVSVRIFHGEVTEIVNIATFEKPEEAALAVRSVNALPSLVEAIEAALPFIDDALDVHTHFPDSAASSKCREVVTQIRAALALAKGE